MKKISALLFLIIFSAPFLFGCAPVTLNQLEKKDLEGADFNNIIAREYRGYARLRNDDYDFRDAEYFAKKAMRAASGVTVDPEHPEDWNIPENLLPSFRQARRDLLDTVNSDIIRHFPKYAARAYFLYDCWLEKQEQNWLEDHIEPCHNQFFETLNRIKIMKDDWRKSKIEELKKEIEELSPPEEEVVEEKAESEGEVKEEKKEEPKQISHIIFFDFDSTAISGEGQQIIGRMIAYLEGNKDYQVSLNGHTDRSGAEDYNLTLSKKRAKVVGDILSNQGIDASRVHLFGFGESDPIRQTEDGVRDPVNRRVEIIVH